MTGSWYVEVDHPSSGNTLRPTILDGVKRIPSANSLPKVRVPVPRSEKWTDTAFETATMRVWYDGERQPIDELYAVETRDDKAILKGRGGTELLATVQKEYDAKPAHTAAEDLVTNETSYTANVDTPSSTVESNVQQQAPDSTSELEEFIGTIDAATPLVVDGGKVKLQQTLFFFEGENPDSGSSDLFNADGYSNDQAARFNDSSDDITFTFTPEYDVPSEHFAIEVRGQNRGGLSPPDVDVILDGENLGKVNFSFGSTGELDWFQAGPDSAGVSEPSSDLTGGSQASIRFNCQESGDDWDWDAIAVYDDRYSYNFVNTLTNGYLDGPELYPNAQPVTFQDAIPLRAVSGGTVSVSIDDTSNGQALELSNDQGDSYASASNTTSFDHDFTDLGAALRFRAQLSRYGSRTTSAPTKGFNGQQLDSYTLEADLDDTPLVAGRSFDTTVLEILQELAAIADDVWAVDQRPEETSVEWTQPGARQRSQPLEASEYTVEKSTASQHEKVTVYGASQQRRAEPWTANHGTFVALEKDNLQAGKEVVYDPSDGTQFELGVDYEMSYRDGEIKATAGGGLTDGGAYEITYRWQPKASYTASGVSDPLQPIVKTIPSLATDRACYQAARNIVAVTKDPVWEGQVVAPTAEVGWSVVEDVELLDVPTNGERLQIREVEATPENAVVQLANRRSISDVVDQIEARLRGASEKV